LNFIKNKKAVGIIGAIMLFMVFIVMWFVWLGGWVAYVGHQTVIDNGLTGVEAFAFDNLNLIIMLVMILAMMGWAYFGGQQ
jgi:hypothetical protein